MRLTKAMLATSIVMLLPACQTQLQKTPDTTPPVLTWVVHDDTTKANVTLPAISSFQGDPAHRYLVVLHADDPQGVMFIELGSTAELSCNLGKEDGLGLLDLPFSPPASVTWLKPDSQGNVMTSAVASHFVNEASEYQCSNNHQLNHVIAETLSGTSLNYSGLPATATLVILFKN